MDFPEFPEVPELEKELLSTLMLLLGQERDGVGVMPVMRETLQFLSYLLRHKKFAYVFVEKGGFMLMLRTCKENLRLARDLSMLISGLSQFTGVMETICEMPIIADELMNTALWLMTLQNQDCSRRETSFFLSVAVSFRALLQLFDQKDGTKFVLDALRHAIRPQTRPTFVIPGTAHNRKTLTNHCCGALKQYLRAHTVLAVEQVAHAAQANEGNAGGSATEEKERRRKQQRTRRSAPGTPRKTSTAASARRQRSLIDLDLQKALQQLEKSEQALKSLQATQRWKPAVNLLQNDGIRLLMETVQRASSPSWRYPDTAVYSLECIQVLLLLPTCQQNLAGMALTRQSVDASSTAENADSESNSNEQPRRDALAIILDVAHRESGIDGRPEVITAALRVVMMCVCHPYAKLPSLPSTRVRKDAWAIIRANNGIKILLRLVKYRVVPDVADSVRALACRSLCALSRDPAIAQILAQLHISRELRDLIRQPVLPERQFWHDQLRASALTLMENTMGTAASSQAMLQEASQPTRAAIAAATKVQYDDRELLQLIHDHLHAKGLDGAAKALAAEAGFKSGVDTVAARGSSSPGVGLGGRKKARAGPKFLSALPCSGVRMQISSRNQKNKTQRSLTPYARARIADGNKRTNNSAMPASAEPGKLLTQSPGRIRMGKKRPREEIVFKQNPPVAEVAPRPAANLSAKRTHAITLDDMVRHYLRAQHAQRPNAASVVPPFSLLSPRRWQPYENGKEAALGSRHSSRNVVSKLRQRELQEQTTRRPAVEPYRQTGGNATQMRHLVYSKFRQVRIMRARMVGTVDRVDEPSATFTCSEFSRQENRLMVGTDSGDVRVYEWNERLHTEKKCHDSEILSISGSTCTTEPLLLTCTPDCVKLWTMDDVMTGSQSSSRLTFEGCYAASFSPVDNSKILGTSHGSAGSRLRRFRGNSGTEARVFDAVTGAKLLTLADDGGSNSKPHHAFPSYVAAATWSPDGGPRVLNDGILWDARASRPIHKFDQLTSHHGYGSWHPSGLEVILDGAVWDCRTFRLRQKVSALANSMVLWDTLGSVLFAAPHFDDRRRTPWNSSCFQTFKGSDYSTISTYDTGRNVLHLSLHPAETCVGVVGHDAASSSVRIYEAGWTRTDDWDSDDDCAHDTDSDNESILDDEGDDLDGRGRRRPVSGNILNIDEDEDVDLEEDFGSDEDDDGDENDGSDDEDGFRVEVEITSDLDDDDDEDDEDEDDEDDE
eukprot:SAG31_NODE_968_length_10678_cov_4.493619_2_plen_1237_part_00